MNRLGPARPTTALLALALCLAASGTARAAKHKVPAQYPTIQAALDAAQPGDKVVVSSGKYTDNLAAQFKSGVSILGKGKVRVVVPDGKALHLLKCVDMRVKNIRFEGGEVNLDGCHDVVVEKCRVRFAAIGFRIENSYGVTLESSLTKNTASSPIRLTASFGCTLRNNRLLHDPTLAEVTLGGESHTIVDNRFVGGAISVSIGGNGHLFAGNHVEGATFYGIFCGTSWGSSILDNVVRDCQDGIRTTTNSYDLLQGNDVRKVSQYGIDVVGSFRLSIRDNVVRKAASAGIHTSGLECHFQANDVRKCGSFGIYVLGDDGNFVGNKARTKPGGVDLYQSIGASGNLFIGNDYVTANL